MNARTSSSMQTVRRVCTLKLILSIREGTGGEEIKFWMQHIIIIIIATLISLVFFNDLQSSWDATFLTTSDKAI